MRRNRPLLLDLFCGAGGAAMGYYRAGFDIVGIDNRPQPRYPFRFIQGDALKPPVRLEAFDAIHASPPCQAYSRLRHLPWLKGRLYPALVEETRTLLEASGVPWVIENVEDAPLRNGVVLCGWSMGLPVYRHRRFESSHLLLGPAHMRHEVTIGMANDRRKGTLNAGSNRGAWGNQRVVTVAGGQCRKADAERAIGVDWMDKPSLMQAIPPAYTELIGEQLMRVVRP